jgi:hypothetical protein
LVVPGVVGLRSTSAAAGRSATSIPESSPGDRGPGGGREGAHHMLTGLKAEHQDACFREFETDTTESVLGVIGAQGSVRERQGHRVGLEVLSLLQFLVLVDLAITAMHYVSGQLPHLRCEAQAASPLRRYPRGPG